MKVILIGTNHAQEDEEIEVTIEQPREGMDTWTFTLPQVKFTISDLTLVMAFLKGE